MGMYDLHINGFIVYRWYDGPLPHGQIVFSGRKLGVGISSFPCVPVAWTKVEKGVWGWLFQQGDNE